jgi:hypothetical protein
MNEQQSKNYYTNTYKGVKVNAIYVPTGVPDYDGNPLIEALPPIMNVEQATKRLSHFPKYEEGMREHDKSLRYQYLRTCLRFFSPLGVHIDLERRLSCAIRVSLIERNPLKNDFINQTEQNIETFLTEWLNQYNIHNNYVSTCAPGLNIVGISGIGKSQAVERILSSYPQVIYHNNYCDKEFAETQIVWLKLDCPFDGSTKGLCFNFFQTVDSILRTNYLKNYAGGRRTTNEMIPSIAAVAANHHLSVLVIDEIQRLNHASSGGKNEMLNFFVQLVNTIGVAVVLVGTFKALEILNGNFSQMRRGTGQGDMVWDRMEFDKNWERFIKSLWKYQFTRKKCSLEDNSDLSKVLYDECQGITDLAIKAYMFAQERAIETGKEVIDARIIRSAAKDKFQIIRPALEAFKSKDKKSIKLFEDAYPTFLEKFLYPDPPKKPSLAQTTVVGQITSEPEIEILLKDQTKDSAKDSSEYNKSAPSTKAPRESTKEAVRGVLPKITNLSSESTKKSAYESLCDSGHIVPNGFLGFINSHAASSQGESA